MATRFSNVEDMELFDVQETAGAARLKAPGGGAGGGGAVTWEWNGPRFDQKVRRYGVFENKETGKVYLIGGPRSVSIEVERRQQASYLAAVMNRYFKPRPVNVPVSPDDWEAVKWVLRKEYEKRQAAQSSK